jgi:hypothetical protein
MAVIAYSVVIIGTIVIIVIALLTTFFPLTTVMAGRSRTG